MEHQTLVRFRWAMLGGGVSPVPMTVLIGTAIVAFRGFVANQDLWVSDQHMTGAGIGEWMRSRDWNAFVHCAAVGGITAVMLYCLNRIVARITAPITAGLGPSPFVRCDHA